MKANTQILSSDHSTNVSLKSGLHDFNADHFGRMLDLIKSAAAGKREILMVACSDHGTAPDNVSFARPENLYVVQNMAGSIPAAGDPRGESAIASMEYAICLKQVRHVIVCGHLGCRIIPYWQKQRDDVIPNDKQAFLNKTTRTSVGEAYAKITGPDRIKLLISEHVLFQIEHLQSHEFVRRRLNNGSLKLHGWVVNDETARVMSFDPDRGQFIPIQMEH